MVSAMRPGPSLAHDAAMTDTKISTVQDIYEAFGRGDVEAILERVTDDVDWASEPDGSAPWHGVHHGKGEVPNFFKGLGEHIEVTEFTPLAFASNETDVMVVIRFGMRVPATGKAGTMDLHHWWRFRDRLVCVYRGTEDTALTERLLSEG
jgi:ketosteroid isomerase-like protein